MTLKPQQIIEDLKFLGKVYGWQMMWHKPEYCELYFRRKGCGLTIWYSKMTVRTAMTHPHMGDTQMYRKRVDMATMEVLFDNPRAHTNKGYVRKGVTNKRKWRGTNATDINELRQRYKKINRRK